MLVCLQLFKGTTCIPGSHGSKKSVSHPWGLEIYTVLSSHIGTGNGSCLLCKSNKCSYPLSHLSSPDICFHMTTRISSQNTGESAVGPNVFKIIFLFENFIHVYNEDDQIYFPLPAPTPDISPSSSPPNFRFVTHKSSVTHMLMSIRPARGAWETHQCLYPK